MFLYPPQTYEEPKFFKFVKEQKLKKNGCLNFVELKEISVRLIAH